MNKGDCFEANANAIIDIFEKHSNDRKYLQPFKLCHGKVIGAKGSKVEGQEFDHAWIEINGDIIADFSNGNSVVGRKETVEHRILRDTVKSYTIRQAVSKILDEENYGPWEELE